MLTVGIFFKAGPACLVLTIKKICVWEFQFKKHLLTVYFIDSYINFYLFLL